jgi:hypothetical protein
VADPVPLVKLTGRYPVCPNEAAGASQVSTVITGQLVVDFQLSSIASRRLRLAWDRNGRDMRQGDQGVAGGGTRFLVARSKA